MEDPNLEWIQQGNTGCVFATILSKNSEKIGWTRLENPSPSWEKEINIINPNTTIVSLIFPKSWSLQSVKNFALLEGFYIENIEDNLEGLRYKNKHGISWVQYFGPKSHVKTRQTPQHELLFCIKRSGIQYYKVGFNGILHLAHASVEHIKEKIRDRIWDKCFKQTKKLLGYKPTIKEAAKTTFIND